MKAIYKINTFITLLMLYRISCSNAQATISNPTNTPITFTEYLGWSTQNSLEFRTALRPRMQIFEPPTIQFNTGFLALGNYLNFLPQTQIHVYNDVDPNFTTSITVSNQFTGWQRSDGFSFGIWGGASGTGSIIQHEAAPIEILTHDINLRMHINFDPTIFNGIVPVTRIAIPEDGSRFQPLSLLHLGQNPINGGFGFILGGYRTWMDVGTLYSASTEQMYVGLIEGDSTSTALSWNDNMDAVINWGDNVGPLDGANHLRFIFTSVEGPFSTAASYQGLEVARITPTGRLGIGNFSPSSDGNGSGINPYRKLEIYDENMDGLLHTAAPQLRLTYGPGQTVNTGIWTDFQTTSTGNLYINPSSSASGTQTNGYVGINTASPGNTLEINSNSASSSPMASGLRFSNLKQGDPSQTSNGQVLTVNPNGDVILTDDIGGIGGVMPCGGSSSSDINYITKWTSFSGSPTICKTNGIYESNATYPTVGIGLSNLANLSTSHKLHVQGDLLLQTDGSVGSIGGIYMYNGFGIQRVFAQYGYPTYGSLAIGADAGPASLSSLSAAGSIYIGYHAGRNTSNHADNLFVGSQAGVTFSGTGNENTFIGSLAANAWDDGSNNTLLGYKAGLDIPEGNSNTFLGSYSGAFMDDGDNNVFIGSSAGLHPGFAHTGDKNVLIGSGASGLDGVSGTDLQNAVTIGFNSEVYCDNCFTIGIQTGVTSQQQVGIGYNNPSTTPIPPPAITPPPPAASPAKLYVNNFNGGTTSAFFNGEIFTTGAYIPSDISLKTNVQNFANALDILDQLEVKQYDYNQALYPSMVLPSGSQVGLMADNVNSVAPQLIRQFSNPSSYDTSGNTIFPQVDFFAVNYTGLIPYLVSAIKEQQHQLDSLAQALSLCCASPIVNPQSNRSALTLTNHASIILNQNSPNPFKEKTDIQYSIPDNVGEAMLVFYDSKGTILSTFEIEHKGEGTLTVYGENLSAGIYTYSLVVDGQVFKTKKMVKE